MLQLGLVRLVLLSVCLLFRSTVASRALHNSPSCEAVTSPADIAAVILVAEAAGQQSVGMCLEKADNAGISLEQAEALTVPSGTNVTIHCQGQLLSTRSSSGRLALENGSTLSLLQCIFTNYYPGEAAAVDASGSSSVETSLFGDNQFATATAQDTFLEVPCSVVMNAPAGSAVATYTHGPTVGSPDEDNGSAAVTFHKYVRSASPQTGPRLTMQNVTAWCGPSWEIARLTAADALGLAMSERPLTPGNTSFGQRGSGAATASAGASGAVVVPPPPSQVAPAAQGAGSGTQSDTPTEPEEGEGRKGRWIRPLVVSSSLFLVWLLMAAMITIAVQRDKRKRDREAAATQHRDNGPSSSNARAMNAPAPTSGSDVTTGVVTPHGSPMLGANNAVQNMLFASGGTGGKNGNTGGVLYKHEEDGMGGHAMIPPGSLPGMHEQHRSMSGSGVGVHPSPQSSGADPFLPSFANEIVGQDLRGRGGEGLDHAQGDSGRAHAPFVRFRFSADGAVGPISQTAMDILGEKPQMHERWTERAPDPSLLSGGAFGVEGVDSELMRKAAGVQTPAAGTPTDQSNTASVLNGSELWWGTPGGGGRMEQVGSEDQGDFDAESRARGGPYHRDSVRYGDAQSTPTGTPGGETPQSFGGGSAGVRRMKDAVHRAMMEMQGDLHEQQLKVFSVLGRGGYGTVYHGQWRGLEVAIKTVIFQSDESDGTMSSLASEAAIASNLSHPNVVAMYSHDICNVAVASCNELDIYKFYLIQEFCNGGSLRHAIARGFFAPGSLRNHWDVVLYILKQVAEAVSYLHSRRICHGDLNPANVLFKYDSGKYNDAHSAIARLEAQAKVGDFGLSRKIQHGRSHTSDIRQGTPFFVAPEVTGQRRLHKSSDAYSFGVMMWELIVGCPVYTIQQVPTDSMQGGEAMAGRGEYVRHPNFPRVPQSVPELYTQTMTACLSQHPEDRPSLPRIQELLMQMEKFGRSGYGQASRGHGSKLSREDRSDSANLRGHPRLTVTSKQTDTLSHLPDLAMRRSLCDSSSSSVFSEPFNVLSLPPGAAQGSEAPGSGTRGGGSSGRGQGHVVSTGAVQRPSGVRVSPTRAAKRQFGVGSTGGSGSQLKPSSKGQRPSSGSRERQPAGPQQQGQGQAQPQPHTHSRRSSTGRPVSGVSSSSSRKAASRSHSRHSTTSQQGGGSMGGVAAAPPVGAAELASAPPPMTDMEQIADSILQGNFNKVAGDGSGAWGSEGGGRAPGETPPRSQRSYATMDGLSTASSAISSTADRAEGRKSSQSWDGRGQVRGGRGRVRSGSRNDHMFSSQPEGRTWQHVAKHAAAQMQGHRMDHSRGHVQLDHAAGEGSQGSQEDVAPGQGRGGGRRPGSAGPPVGYTKPRVESRVDTRWAGRPGGGHRGRSGGPVATGAAGTPAPGRSIGGGAGGGGMVAGAPATRTTRSASAAGRAARPPSSGGRHIPRAEGDTLPRGVGMGRPLRK